MCDAIYEKTQIQLSLSTIKRLWDSTYNKTFQIKTLDALVQYLDYRNWHHFKEQYFKEVQNQYKEKNGNQIRIDNQRKRLLIKLALLVFIIVTISILAFLSTKRKENNVVISTNDIVFTSKKSIKEGVPNTIIFNYDVSLYETDSLWIQLSWNKKERELINRNDHFYTCTYYYPGYHYAKVVVNNEFVNGHYVHITTKDWLTLVRYKPDDVLPTYIKNTEVISNGTMYASPYLLKLNNIDVTKNEFYVSYFNIKEFGGLEADNFAFETEIKISNKKLALICQTCWFYIYGENGSIVLPICSQGCVSDIGILAGDIRISGKTNDLSTLGCDLTEWRKVRGEVVNKEMKIYIDNKHVYTLSYNTEIGKIKGLHYFFKGCGAVKKIRLFDPSGSVVYTDDFIN